MSDDTALEQSQLPKQLPLSTANDSPLKQFHLFAQLPSELRLRCWELAIPPPREVQVRYKPTYRWRSRTSWVTPTPIPAILQACHDSRELGLKHHKLAFGTYNLSGYFYFDFSRDTLLLSDALDGVPTAIFPKAYLLDLFLSAEHGVNDTDKIERIQFDFDESLFNRASTCWEEIRLLPALKEFTLVTRNLYVDGDDWEVVIKTRESLRHLATSHLDWKIPHTVIMSTRHGQMWEYPNDEDQTAIQNARQRRVSEL